MVTYNTYFDNYEKLNRFIQEHQDLDGANNLLIQIFSGIVEEKPLKELSLFLLKKLPQSKIIGSTTDGEILNDEVSTEKIVISFSIFEKSTLNISYVQTNCNQDSFNAGQTIAKNLCNDNTKALILFASGLCVNGEEFLKGIHDINEDIIVAGGLSGDNAEFKNSYLLCNDIIQTNGAVGVAINSDVLNVQNRYSFSWDNLGRKFKVEKAIKNRVYLIDGQTPYELYRDYLGQEVAQKLPGIGIEFPLIIQKKRQKIARAVIQLHEDGSMSFAGNIKQGSIVRFGIGNIEALLKGSYDLCHELNEYNNESIFIYSCMARRRYLENKSNLDIEHFSKLSNVAGFFTYGEFFTTDHSKELLNESLTLLSLSEKSQKPTTKLLKPEKDFSNTLLKQKALSHIINKTSEELDNLTENLEKKIEEKTKENIQHEKYIFEQDKLAQLGEMIANIAHQWRQPLSAISSNASSIRVQQQLGITTEEEIDHTMQRIIKNTEFLSETINTFRDYIKEENQEKIVVIQDRLNLVLDIISTTLNDCSIELINDIDYSKPIYKSLIVGELSQVVLNLINNSKDILLEKNIENPWVKVTCCTKDGKIVINIEDNGGGIPKDIMGKIFDPYFTTKHQSQGTGIGLYMSKNIIKNHLLGELYVTNSENGAKFTIELPLENKL